MEQLEEETAAEVLYEIRHHANGSFSPDSSQKQTTRGSRVGWLSYLSHHGISQLRDKWDGYKRSGTSKRRLSLFVSPSGEHVAVAIGNQIIILQKDDEYMEPCGIFFSNDKLTAFDKGAWLEPDGILGIVGDDSTLYFIKSSGEEITRRTKSQLKLKSPIVDMIVSYSLDSKSSCLTGFLIFTANGLLHHVDIAQELSTSIYPSSQLTKGQIPHQVSCVDFHPDLSLLVLVGAPPNSTDSTGSYYLYTLSVNTSLGPELLFCSPGFEGIFSDSNDCSSLIKSPKVAISMKGKYVATLDLTGCVDIFHLDVKKHALSPLYSVKGQDQGMSSNLVHGRKKYLIDVIDMSWWDDHVLVLANKNGVITMYDVLSGKEFSENDHTFSMPVIERVKHCEGYIFLLEATQQTSISEHEGSSNMHDNQQIEYKDYSQLDTSQSCWSLMSFSSRSVSQVYALLIKNGKYHAALDFAGHHGLDRDETFKAQWLHSDQTPTDIDMCLSKIKDQNFVLSECINKVGPTEEFVKALLSYGLQITDKYKFSDSNETDCHLIWDFRMFRLQLLQYRERLETFVGINMGRYQAQEYAKFRGLPLIESAMSLAESGKIGALNLLVKRHPYSLSPGILDILSSIPETIPVQTYSQLLPGRSPPTTFAFRDADWIECEEMVVYLKEVMMGTLVSSTENIMKHSTGLVWPSTVELSEWYKKRARDIDNLSGQLDNSLALVEFACRKGVIELQQFFENISYLHQLIYSDGVYEDFNMSLVAWEHLSDYEKFRMMLKGIKEDKIVDRLREKAIPFMRKHLYYKTLDSDTETEKEQLLDDCSLRDSFLVRWLKEIAAENKLEVCFAVIENGCGDSSIDGLFKDEAELIETTLQCIYACSLTDQWNMMASILSKLPQKILRDKSQIDAADNLEKRIKITEGHVEVGRLLAYYQVPKPISFFLDAQSDEKNVKQLLRLILSKFGRRQPGRSDHDWANMWRDMQCFQEKAFPFLELEYMLIEFIRGLLKAGKFSLARNYLKGTGSITLASEKTENLVIQAAREYFFSAPSLACTEIWKAKECLNLLPNYKNVQSEADLIDALTIRLPNLGVTLLPMQFRQIKNPMEIINMAISSQNGVYVNVDELIEIAKLLGLGSPDEIAAVEEAIAREAAVAGDLQLACDLCLTLAKKGHGSVWDLCAAIARGPELGSMDTGSRKKLLGFALSHCDEESVGELLNAWKDVDMQCQYAQLITLSGTCPPNFSINNSSLISLPIHSVEDILNLRAASELLSSPCHENWVGNEIDFQRVKGTLPDIGRNLCVEDGISWESLLMENKKVLAFSALELPWLQELSRTEKYGKQATPELKSRSGKPRISISTQALLTVLCWMAGNDIAPNDDLIASLAKSVMEPPVTEEEDVLGCSFLLNLVDAFWGVGVIEEQLRSREVYHEVFSIMNIGMTYSSLHNSSAECSRPDQRRELLLQKFHENHASLGSDDMDQIDQAQSTFWREWKMKLEKQKQLADQARALEQLIPGIETARFLSGDTKYIKSAVFSFIDSIKLKKKHILKDAVLLADIYGLRRTEVLLQFFASALVSEHWETDDILAEISEYREDIVACAKEVIDMISDVVYPEIEGHNKRRLSYIYSILSACCLRLRAEDLASAYLDVGQIHMLDKFQFYKILEQECQKVSFINELNFKNIAGLNDLNFDHFNEEICSNIRESTVGVLADMVRTLVGIYSDSQARGLISWQTVYKHYVVSLLASLESKHIDCANPGELCTLITETAVSYDSCKKYVRVLSEADAADIICRFCKLCIQCSFSDSLKDESAWKNCLIMLLNLWIKIAQDLTETASDETFSEEPISFDCKYLSGCLNVFKRLLMEGEISVDQGWRAISSYSRLGFAFTSSNDISVFCEAMIFSGCGFQLVAEVYYESELSSASLCSHGKELNLVDLYIKLADGILSGFSRGEPERQKLHFLLSSISRSGNKHMDDLKIIRHEVWKKLSALSDNMQLESDDRVYALELMQSISGNNVKSLPVGLASEIRPWEAWDDTHWKKSSASIEEGDIPSSITSNLVALRSTQLAAAISPNIKISPEDLLTLDAALSCFLRISEFSTTLEDLNVLQAVLKEWEELFSSRVEKEKTSEPLKELNNWGNDDWDEGWEDLPEEPDRRDEKQNRSDSILPLHKCWMEIVKRLVGLSRLDAVVELLDRSLLKHEGALLDEDDTHSLFQLVVGIDCLMALKMMLLLPYKAPQVQCMHILESNLKDGSMPTAPVGDDNQVLTLVLSSGVLRDAAADPAFSKVFSYICYSAGCLARLCQEDLLRCTNNRSKQNLKRSLFFCKVLFPYFIAELVNAGQYLLAGSCVSQWMHTPTSLSLINIVEASLRRYLEGQVLQAHTIAGNELNLMELDSCGSLEYTASCLRDKLGILIQSALSALPTDPLK